MKFSTFTSTLIATALVFASSTVADVDFFDWPYPNQQFKLGSCIQFVVDDLPDNNEKGMVANLYRSNGAYVKTIRNWYRVHDDDDFTFTWCIDRSIRPGQYYVQLVSNRKHNDDVSKSFLFTIGNTASPPIRNYRSGRQY